MAYQLERQIHAILAEYATGREWFKTSPEVVRAAASQAKKDLGGKHIIGDGWRFDIAEQREQKRVEVEERRYARGETEHAYPVAAHKR